MNNSNDTIKTGFSTIDVVTGGLKPSEVMVIAGQGRTGKTSLALSIAKKRCRRRENPLCILLDGDEQCETGESTDLQCMRY